MYVSSHDALLTVLLAVYAAALVWWCARRVGSSALADLDAVGSTLAAVGEGRRDMRTGLTGSDEIARLGRDVDAMIARLDRSERARRELFAAVSHDLRTPITALGLLATAIDDEVVEDAKRREYAARMNTHVRALAALIDDLFDLTRLETQELEWTMEHVAVEDLVHDAVEAMRPAADAEYVAVRAELHAPVGASRGNHEQLQRVMFNLIQNAIRHTPPDGSVTVRAEDVDGGVEIEVADTGSGIARRCAGAGVRAVLPGGCVAARARDGAGARDCPGDRGGAWWGDLVGGRAGWYSGSLSAAGRDVEPANF